MRCVVVRANELLPAEIANRYESEDERSSFLDELSDRDSERVPHGPALCNRGMKALPRVPLQLSEFTSVDERPCQATHFPWLRGKL